MNTLRMHGDGFDALALDPNDQSWTDKVISAVALKELSQISPLYPSSPL